MSINLLPDAAGLYLAFSFAGWFIFTPLYLWFWLRRVKKGASITLTMFALLMVLYIWLLFLHIILRRAIVGM